MIAHYLREHEGRPIELGGRVKGCFKKERNDSSADTPTKSSTNVLKNGINDPLRAGLNKKVSKAFKSIPLLSL